MPDSALPLLAIVAGRPGSGKTTLAIRLAEELRWPLVSRDRLKEGAVRTLGWECAADPGLALRVCGAFFAEIELLLRAGVSLVAEAAFQHKVWSPRLEPILPLTKARVILCDAPPNVALERRRAREAKDPLFGRFHPPAADSVAVAYDPPKLHVPTLQVDTSDGYAPAFEEILSFLG
jgi:predicted kinase